MLRRVSFSILLNLSTLGLGRIQIEAGLLGPLLDQFARFAEYRFQFAPKLIVVDIVSVRVVQFFIRLLSGIHQTARCERAALAPAVAVVVDARDKSGIS